MERKKEGGNERMREEKGGDWGWCTHVSYHANKFLPLSWPIGPTTVFQCGERPVKNG